MNKLVSKFCIVSVAFVIFAMMLPVIAFADEANLKIPSVHSQNNLLYIGLYIISIIGIIFALFLYLRRRKDKSS